MTQYKDEIIKITPPFLADTPGGFTIVTVISPENIKILKPDFKSAEKLSPLQLNAFRIQKKHTPLTPEQLERFSKTSSK